MNYVALHDVASEVARDETRILHPIDEEDTGARLLVEFYCGDPACDCRRVVLAVVRASDAETVATVGYRFDGPAEADDVHGWPEGEQTHLDPDHPQSDEADAFLETFRQKVLSSNYVRRLEHHDELVAEADLEEVEIRPSPEVRDDFDPEQFGGAAESSEGHVYLDDEEVEEAARERQRKKRLLSRSERRKVDKTEKLARYRLDRCLVNTQWRSALWAQLTAVREMPDDAYAVLFVLVDLGCLGVKNFAVETGMDDSDLDGAIDRIYAEADSYSDCSLELASRILHHGVTWSERASFEVGEGFFVADAFLGDADPADDATPIPLGRDGEPFYVPSPGDNWEAVMDRLDEKLGSDNYGYMIPSNLER